MNRICVLGDGAWGSALASLARECGHEVAIWSRKRPDTKAVGEASAIILALPAQVIGPALQALPVNRDEALIIAAKGIDRFTHRFMHQVVKAACPNNPVFILSGPSFADDVLRKLPTAVSLAGETLEAADHWAKALSRPHFRIYASDDLMGVAIGGSLKNVLAIACGISDGKQLGASARAALIARGFSELSRLGRKLGAKPETLMGLSGLGDLLLTCSSPQSRNYSFGKRLGEGMSVADAIAASKGVVEGVSSAHAALALAREHNLAMPITEAIFEIVENNANADDMIKALLARPVGAEFN
jgi:glycerol-3-phosphate dehydrogenase (NAD(P)+)